MCLTIDRLLHGDNKPRVALRDILVYKKLEGVNRVAGYSPYFGSLYKFGELKDDVIPDARFTTVDEGLHAYTYKPFNRHYPAVIPKGSYVYFGWDNEIVSDKMIVYRNIKDLEAVHGKIGAGVPKREIAK